jgi:hypothetical protein
VTGGQGILQQGNKGGDFLAPYWSAAGGGGSNSAGVNSSLTNVKSLISPKGIKVLRLMFVSGIAFRFTGAAIIKATICPLN